MSIRHAREISELRQRVADQDKQLDELSRRLEALEKARRPGRPRKEDNGAD